MRGSWDWQRAVAIATGGVLGAGLRWAVLTSVGHGTLFSTFSVEVVNLAQDGSQGIAALYAATSVATTIAGVAAGAAALHRLRAVMTPLEEQP